MKNPLIKRLPRELKGDLGKYLVIFLFLVMLISLISGFLIADSSLKTGYDDGFEKYNIEDGHLAFNRKPDDQVLENLEDKADIKLYDLKYFEEQSAEVESTVRVYKLRDQIDLQSMWDGRLPEKEDEIAVDRLYAANNDFNIGDTITLGGKKLTICGTIAVPDYSCLFENSSDMMFNAKNFGVGLMTDSAFEAFESAHITYNYAWKYNTPYDNDDDITAKEKSDDLLDDLEDVLKDYDKDIIQAQVDDLYDKAEVLSDTLEDEMNDASDVIEDKMTDAAEDAVEEAEDDLTTEELLDALLDKSGMDGRHMILKLTDSLNLSKDDEILIRAAGKDRDTLERLGVVMYVSGLSEDEIMERALDCMDLSDEDAADAILSAAAEKENTTEMALLADKLGTTEKALQDMSDSVDSLEDDMDDLQDSTGGSHEVDLDDYEAGGSYDEDASFDLQPLKDMVEKVKETGLYDTADIESTISEIEELTDFELDETKILDVDDYVPRYVNQAINFTGDDMGSDRSMFLLFDYIITVILAFVFAVTTSNTISAEAGVIGTLRASGYTRGELVRHYIALPVAVTIAGGIIGNILGYTVFPKMFLALYLNSYSLAKCGLLFNSQAFILTTVVPIVLMFVINLAVLEYKLQLSPLKFLRHDLKRSGRKRAVRLPKNLPFMSRFRLRVLLQNIPAYLVLFTGIFFGGVLVVFGLMFSPLLDDYADLVVQSKLAEYQYVLMDSAGTDIPGAEKYWMEELNTVDEDYMIDSVSIYGVEPDSAYVKADIPEGEVLLSNGFADKFGYAEGDLVELKDPYGPKIYEFRVAGTYTYDAALCVFMNRDDFMEKFDKDSDEFTGYFSNEELTDIDDDDIATTITESDLTKMSDQLQRSMGDMMGLFEYFGVIMFMLLMYILTKQIIEKNMQSIAMTKILGFRAAEIAGLYLVITFAVVVISLLVSVPLIDEVLRWCFKSYIYTMMTGYIPYIISNDCYIKMVVLGTVSFIAVAGFLLIKINRIPKSEALKNVE